jgi:hypothetical protein
MKTTALLLVLGTGLLPAALPPRANTSQTPAQVQAAERTKLLDGVTAIPKLGAPGPVAIFGLKAFPVFAASADGKSQMALCAAAELGKGRVVIFGHTGYLDAGGANADLLKLLENAARWCAAPSGRTHPRVGVRQGGSETVLGKRGLEARRSVGKLNEAELRKFDVVILSAQGLTEDSEAQALETFIKNGGGCIAATTGWAFAQTSGGKTLSDEHAGNRALREAGLAWTEMSFPDQVRTFEAKPELPRLMNASEAVLALRASREQKMPLSEDDMNQALSSIQIALAAQSSDRAQQVAEVVMAALGKSEGAVPTPQKPMKQTENPGDRMRLVMEARVMKIASGAKVAAHPAAAHFPGKVPADAKRVTQKVEIDPTIPGWHSTGLYAAPGEKITVTLPAALAGKGFSLRIGCHTDTLYHLESWSRAPEISRSVRLKEAATETASAFGGLVYLEVPSKDKTDSPFSVSIAGAVEAPLFVLGKTDDKAWNEVIKKRPAPWAEFACDKVILACPTEVARKVTNPTELMEFWTKVVEDQDDISNQAAERRRPERIVSDVQISAGYMHSGYPIMVPVSAAPEMVTYSKLKFPGWGFYHELGHNHQRGDFTFDGTGEVTNNVLALHVFEAVLGKDKTIGHTGVSVDAQKKHIEEIKKAGNKFATWKKEPFTALTTYIQLVDGFGWDAWKKYLYSFGDASFGPKPTTDDEKRDQFLVRYSKIVNRNLGPLFEFWGIPVSSSAKSEVAKLEAWMPKGVK